MKRNTAPAMQSSDFLQLFTLILLPMLGGCAAMEVASRWPDQKIILDGKSSEWTDKTFLIQDKKLSVGIANDSNFVYVMLSTSDRQLARKIVSQGLTVWFDSQGGRDKTFGIRHPLGFSAAGSSPSSGGEQELTMQERGIASLNELEILGPGDDNRHRMPVIAAEGIEARLGLASTSITYELKVPYIEDSRYPFSINGKRGSQVGIGLETPVEYSPAGAPSGSARGTGGGRGRGSRGGGGTSTGSDQGRLLGSAEPLNVWMKVQLALPDSTGPLRQN